MHDFAASLTPEPLPPAYSVHYRTHLSGGSLVLSYAVEQKMFAVDNKIEAVIDNCITEQYLPLDLLSALFAE